ncbi:hypothetical protein MJO28_007789 [Puccinia striiformis f. sp. tritici]|uniref:Uncharacterized protein n=1 Tax=Puccinia striiformis f. sp. tritici TaxID=168172 RepID=A0ACC0EGE7_9BASI|nr:hypothetical protein MJO28_007789 [Puccinia striiformis f. sp. tritici]
MIFRFAIGIAIGTNQALVSLDSPCGSGTVRIIIKSDPSLLLFPGSESYESGPSFEDRFPKSAPSS